MVRPFLIHCPAAPGVSSRRSCCRACWRSSSMIRSGKRVGKGATANGEGQQPAEAAVKWRLHWGPISPSAADNPASQGRHGRATCPAHEGRRTADPPRVGQQWYKGYGAGAIDMRISYTLGATPATQPPPRTPLCNSPGAGRRCGPSPGRRCAGGRHAVPHPDFQSAVG